MENNEPNTPMFLLIMIAFGAVGAVVTFLFAISQVYLAG